jgi:hypothetical protein
VSSDRAATLNVLVYDRMETPHFTGDVRLPAFERSLHEPYAWPPPIFQRFVV